MTKKLTAVLLCMLMSVTLLAGCQNDDNSPINDLNKDGRFKIAFIPSEPGNSRWADVDKGAQEAAAELKVKVDLLEPVSDESSAQVEAIEKAAADGYDAIMISAINTQDVFTALDEAKKADMNIVYVYESNAAEADGSFFIDNISAGEIAGQQLLSELLDAEVSSGYIGIISGDDNTGFFAQREDGFRTALENSGFSILETQYSGVDTGQAEVFTNKFIGQEVCGVFGVTESATEGIGKALSNGENHDVIAVGFGSSEEIMTLVNDGWLSCSISENLHAMGSDAVKAVVAALENKADGVTNKDSGVSVIKKDAQD